MRTIFINGHKFIIELHKDKNDGESYIALENGTCVSEGVSEDELIRNLREDFGPE